MPHRKPYKQLPEREHSDVSSDMLRDRRYLSQLRRPSFDIHLKGYMTSQTKTSKSVWRYKYTLDREISPDLKCFI